MIEIITDRHEVVGRKTHRCEHCQGSIDRGEKHLVGTYKCDDIYTIRQHIACAAFCDKHGEYFYDPDTGQQPIWDWETGILPMEIEEQRLALLSNAKKRPADNGDEND